MVNPLTFAGLPVIIKKPRIVELSWTARLLSWPWRPWKKFHVMPPIIPDGQIFRVAGRLLMTEATWTAIQKQLPPSDSENSLAKSRFLC